MGDIKEVLHKPLKLLPLAMWAVAGPLGSISLFGGAALTGLEAFGLGSTILALGAKRKHSGNDSYSPTYSLSKPSNSLSNMLPLPIVYGKMRMGGNIIWQRTLSDQEVARAVALCAGPVSAVEDIRINNRPVSDCAGSSATGYVGLTAQTPDARMSAYYKGSVKRLAYLAATLKATEQVQGDPVLTAVVKGRECEYWDGDEWLTGWTRNPAWIIRDFLINIVGVSSNLMDDDAFIAAAAICDATVSGEYDRGENVATSGTITGGTNPTHGNDGSYTCDDTWSVTAAQNENLVELGVLDLGSAKLCSQARVYLYDGDSREYYNWKLEGSANGVDYTTLFDGTGSGVNYKGCQIVDFTRASYRYFRVSGSGNTVNTGFHVKEIEVYEDIAAVRYALDVCVDAAAPARDILEDMLASFGGYLTFSKGLIGLKIDGDSAAAAAFDDTNIIEDSIEITSIARAEKPNRTVIYFVNPLKNWLRDDVSDDDLEDQQANGIRQKELSLLYITRPGQARRMARLAGNIARQVKWIASWRAGLNAVACLPGDVVTLTCDFAGWTTKKFKITDIEEQPDGSRKITAREHIASIYADQAGGYYDANDYSTLSDPDEMTAPRACTGMVLTEDKRQHQDGTWLPLIHVDFDKPPDVFYSHCEVQLSSDGSTYDTVGICTGVQYDIENVPAGTWYVRLVAVNIKGLKSPYATCPADDIIIGGKADAPGNVTGFSYVINQGLLQLYWDTARDANNDLSYYEIRDGASWASGTVLATDIKATKIAVSPTKGSYNLYIKAFDRSGNESSGATNLSITFIWPQTTGLNLLPNGGFEYIKKVGIYGGDTGFVPGWTIASTTAGIYISDLATSGYPASYFIGGQYLLELKASTSEYCYITSTDIPVSASTKYQFSGYFKISDNSTGDQSVTVRLYYLDYAKSLLSYSDIISSQALAKSAMTRYVAAFTTPANTAYIEVRVYANTMASGWSYIQCDALQIEFGEQATAYSDPPVRPVNLPVGVVNDPTTGFNVYDTSGNLIVRAGIIGGLSDGLSGTIAAGTRGIWVKGEFDLLNDDGDLVLSAGGLEDPAFVDGSITEAMLDSLLKAKVQTTGNTDSARPHDWMFGLMSKGLISATSTFPQTVAHGLKVKPFVVAMMRGKNTSGSPTYSKWEMIPYHNPNSIEIRIGIDATNISFYLIHNNTYQTSLLNNWLFFLEEDDDDHWINGFEEVEIYYAVFREGAA